MAENNEGNQNDPGQQPPPPDGTSPQGDAPTNWEEWLDGQPETIQQLYQSHTSGLRSALQSEREQRKDFERQIRDLSGKLEQGSEAQQQLESMADQVKQEGERADFYEDASREGVADLRLAWLAVQSAPDEYLKRGRVDFAHLKETHPALFGPKRQTSTDGGQGTQSPPPAGQSIDDRIRGRVGGPR